MYFKHRNYIFLYYLILFTFLFCIDGNCQNNDIIIEKISATKDKNIAIYLNRKGEYKIYTLAKPDRLIFELNNGKIKGQNYQIAKLDYINKIKFSDQQKKLIVTFSFSEKLFIKKTSFDKVNNIVFCQLDNKKSNANLDINSLIASLDYQQKDKISEKKNPAKTEIESQNLIIKKTENSIVKFKVRNPQQNVRKILETPKKPIIVIDAGHGGKDPGTIGIYARTKEKNITLSYAKELAKTLINDKKYKVYLTRDDDYFIPLDKRVEKSRRKKADLFISLHANSTSDNDISGFSIYTLSEKSSDKKAELLAQKENQADIINGIDFSGASRDITKTLIDMSQRESKNSSAKLAQQMIYHIRNANIEILQNTHRFAGFMVLTAPDMASVLIELGYLSNKREEEMLNSASYRRLVAKTLARAIDAYFNNFKK